MSSLELLNEAQRKVFPAREDWADAGWIDFNAAIDKLAEGRQLAALLEINTEAKALLTGIFGNSPFLKRLIVKNPEAAMGFLKRPSKVSFAKVLADLELQMAEAGDNPAAMKALRIGKARVALLIAMADLCGAWSLDDVTRALSEFADKCLDLSFRHMLRHQAESGKCIIEGDSPEGTCGIGIIAMGKYGAFELNYSSDIDIVVFFEPAKIPVTVGGDPQKLAIRLTKGLVTLMQEATGDGYVFRTDLRLRPDASATAVALSVDAASFYYETMGQNWERAAWIKARACAGDKNVGQAFLKSMEPYIWRRYLDYAAIEDIHSIKRQIHANKGHAKIAAEGHNIKLGRGGIREIEFFTQTQQLIGGGRDRALRDNTTFGGLKALTKAGIVDPKVMDELVAAYRFLREVEHRLQMVNDEQTHVMPKTKEEVDAIGCFAGYDDPKVFRKTLRHHHRVVQTRYAELFEEEPSLGSAHGNLVFTGVEDDPGTLETLEGMGFQRPSRAAEAVRTWHHGRIRVMRSERSRGLLTKLVPHLLEAFSRTEDPDAAMANFDRFITGLPAGVQLFSMLLSHPELIVLLADILGTAPRLAKTLANNAGVLDVLLDPDFYHSLPHKKELKQSFAKALAGSTYFEDVLDASRIWASEMRFRAGVNVLTGHMEARQLGPFFADFTDTIIAGLQPAVEKEMVAKFGSIDGDFSVIALGKLGSREMSASSDLDIIFVYDTPSGDTRSEGPKILHNTQYFARLSQRLISALTAPTSEGQMFEIDARLRPSGNSGPIAIRFEGFDRYQKEEAWTWEKMALTRARILTGSQALISRVTDTIKDVLTMPKDKAVLLKDVSEMRRRIFAENGSTNPWDLKHVQGGLVDIEFIAQALQLVHGEKHPKVLGQNTIEALRNLGREGCVEDRVIEDLVEAAELHHNLTQVTRVCVEGALDPETASQNLRSLVAKAGEEASLDAVEKKLARAQVKVHQHFVALIDNV
jgi:[glutamine synthetase] adenylyltransferase / [glutamine synthetase]-adenylyl-L-tyrosine phosphorylase